MNLVFCAISADGIRRVCWWSALFVLWPVPSVIDLPFIYNSITIIKICVISLKSPVHPPLYFRVFTSLTSWGHDISFDRVPGVRIDWSICYVRITDETQISRTCMGIVELSRVVRKNHSKWFWRITVARVQHQQSIHSRFSIGEILRCQEYELIRSS